MILLRKIASLALLATFTLVVFNYLIFSVCIYLKKAEFRQQVFAHGLESREFEVITLPANQLFENVNAMEWLDDGKEISISGKLYEVLGIKKKGTAAEVSILEDKKESELFSSFLKSGKKDTDFFLLILKIIIGLNFTSHSSYQINSVFQSGVLNPIRSESIFSYEHFTVLVKPPAL